MRQVDDVSLVFYSHSTYSDLWDIFVSSVDKYLTMEFKKYHFLCDEGQVDDKYETHHYDVQYSKRLLSVIEKVETEFVVVHHEDHFFHAPVNEEKFLISKNVLKQNDDISFIKYAKAGTPMDIMRLSQHKNYKNFNLIRSDFDYVYTVQPNLWKTSRLKEILNRFDLNGWKLETDTREYCVLNNIQGLCYYSGNERQRGKMHWDSSVYPTINAISKGKWTISHYKNELTQVTEEHNVDMNIRGYDNG